MAKAVKRRLKSVKLALRVDVTPGPVAGCCTYRKGRLVYIASGFVHHPESGRVSNFFDYRTVQKDGTLGRWSSGYWNDDWSK